MSTGAVRRHRPRARRRTADERGSVALVLVVIVVGLFAMAGLVLDGGVALDARGRAASVAQQAARAGASALSPASLRGRSPDLRVDPIAATQAARAVLVAGDARGEVSVSGSSVTVTAHVSHRAVMLSAFGMSELTGSASATATAVYGVTTGRTG